MHRAGQHFLQSGRIKKSVGFLSPKDGQTGKNTNKQDQRNNPIRSSLKKVTLKYLGNEFNKDFCNKKIFLNAE